MGNYDETLQINTPENVAFGYEIAGIGSRFLAALVDTSIITFIQVIVAACMFTLLSSYFGEDLEQLTAVGAWLLAAGGLLMFMVLWGFYIFFEVLWNGQSPGKRLASLRVMRTDGTPITLTEAIIRNLVRLVDFLPYFYGVGVIVMFVNDQSRRLGDLAAGTLVVHDRQAVALESLRDAPLPTSTSAATGYPVEHLSPADLLMAEEYLKRRAELSNRELLAQRIAQALLARMGELPDVALFEAEKTIEQIVQESRARRAGRA